MRRRRIYYRKNFIQYAVVVGLFIVGIIIGALYANLISSDHTQDLNGYIKQFLYDIGRKDVASGTLFKIAFFQYFKSILILWILGLFIFGIPFIYIYVAVKGIGYGFTSAFLIKQLGWKGFLFGFIGYLPQNLLFIPTLLFIAIVSIKYCKEYKFRPEKVRSSRQTGDEQQISFLCYILCLIGACAVVLLCSLGEAYITPYLIKWFIA